MILACLEALCFHSTPLDMLAIRTSVGSEADLLYYILVYHTKFSAQSGSFRRHVVLLFVVQHCKSFGYRCDNFLLVDAYSPSNVPTLRLFLSRSLDTSLGSYDVFRRIFYSHAISASISPSAFIVVQSPPKRQLRTKEDC